VLYQVNSVATGPQDRASVYAAASIYDVKQSALFRSPDAGKTWTALVEATGGEFYSEIAVDPRDSQRLFAGASGNSGTASIYRSIDGGETWSKRSSVSPSCTPSFAPGSSHDTVLLSCGKKVLRSQDAGATWTELTAPFTEPTRLTAGAPGTVLAYGASGIFRSTNDGGTWASVASPPPACSRILALRVDPGNAQVFVAGTGKLGSGGFECGGVFRSANSGKTWGNNALSGVYVTDVVIDPLSRSTFYASASYLSGILPRGGVFRSQDNGVTWTDLHVPALGALRLAMSPSGSQLHAATPIGVFDLGFRRTRTVPPRE
jgi:photosystem II stability/assembly factor-like uncharacterized protein